MANYGQAMDMTNQHQTISQQQPNWYDPLGPAAMTRGGKPIFAPTGGVPLRTDVFNAIGAQIPAWMANADQSANLLGTAATDPGWEAAAKLARGEINGDYLNGSPALDNAMSSMRAASSATSANAAARARSQFAQNGMSFGTGNQEAEQNAAAGNTASANNAEAQARLQNYEAERGIQNQAPALLNSSLSSPINYLAQIPNQYLGPLSQITQIVSGLAGSGKTAQPDTLVQKSLYGQMMGDIGI